MKRLLNYSFVIFLMVFSFSSLILHAENNIIELESALQTMNQVKTNQVQYYPASYYAVMDAYTLLGGDDEANRLLTDPLATQEEIDIFAAQLRQLISELIYFDSYRTLNELFIQVRDQSRTSYTLRSVAIFDQELERIRVVKENPRSGENAIQSVYTDLQSIHNLLIPLGDKTNIQITWQTLQDIILHQGNLYRPNSYVLFETRVQSFETEPEIGIYTVKEMITFSDASVAEVNLTQQRLDEAFALLVLRANKQVLQTTYDNAQQINFTQYTPVSVQAFQQLLNLIEGVLLNHNATQEETDQAVLDLINGINSLELLADKTKLIQRNQQVLIAYYDERSRYTNQSYELFREMVLSYGHYLAVNQLVDNANATQIQVDDFESKLMEALNQLVVKGNVEPLQNQVQAALAKDFLPYTPKSVEVFFQDIVAVQAIIQSPDTSEADVQAGLALLQIVLSRLQEKADKSSLIIAIQKNEQLTKSRYTRLSQQVLELKLVQANALRRNESASQDEVDQMTNLLTNLRSQLLLEKGPIMLRANQEGISLLDRIFIHETSIKHITSLHPEIASVDESMVLTGHKFGQTKVIVELANGLVEEIEVSIAAEVSTLTIVLAAIIPVTSISSLVVFLFVKPQHFAFLKKFKWWKKV